MRKVRKFKQRLPLPISPNFQIALVISSCYLGWLGLKRGLHQHVTIVYTTTWIGFKLCDDKKLYTIAKKSILFQHIFPRFL